MFAERHRGRSLLFKSEGAFMSLNIVLFEPEIPQNTGNIARTCAATRSRLHLIKPMGFEINDRKLKRAGLDYWYLLDITYYDGLEHFFAQNSNGRVFYCSTKAQCTYTQAKYSDGDYLVFGKETAGLPESLLKANLESCIRIPMLEEARSLNLSNSVAIVVYEALRQTNFENLLASSSYLTKSL